MKSMNCKLDLYHSTVPKTACIDIGQLLSSIPASPSLYSELFKLDDNLIAEIYNVVENILRNPLYMLGLILTIVQRSEPLLFKWLMTSLMLMLLQIVLWLLIGIKLKISLLNYQQAGGNLI